MAMLWVAYDPSIYDHRRNREQFNGPKPDWMDTIAEWKSKQDVEVPRVGDSLSLRMGNVIVMQRRLESPEIAEHTNDFVSPWYWTIIVKRVN